MHRISRKPQVNQGPVSKQSLSKHRRGFDPFETRFPKLGREQPSGHPYLRAALAHHF
jgi:hypothetical protein